MTEQMNTTNTLLQQIRDSKSVGRKKRQYKSRSKLYPATNMIMKLYDKGDKGDGDRASLSEIQFYLEYRHDPPIRVASRTTIKNYIDKVKSEAQIIDEPLY